MPIFARVSGDFVREYHILTEMENETEYFGMLFTQERFRVNIHLAQYFINCDKISRSEKSLLINFVCAQNSFTIYFILENICIF